MKLSGELIKRKKAMKLPVAIYLEQSGGYVARVPGIPDCSSKGQTIEFVLEKISGLVHQYFYNLIEEGKFEIFSPPSIESLRSLNEYDEAIWSILPINKKLFDNKLERVNITVPAYYLALIDDYMKSQNLTNRSKFFLDTVLYKVELARSLTRKDQKEYIF